MQRTLVKSWQGSLQGLLARFGLGHPASGQTTDCTPARPGWPQAGPLLLLFLVAAISIWWLFARGAEVAVVTARRGDAVEVVYATGVVEPLNWAKVTALHRKRIVEICKCEGQPVSKGDVLARLDDVEERAGRRRSTWPTR